MMSYPVMGKDDPGDGNRPSNSRTSDKTIQLNKIVLNQSGLCALDVGKQQLQNLQGCNVFILSPTQLKNLGLVAKMKNGKPVIMHESKGGGTTENITETLSVNQLVPLLESTNVSPDTVAVDRANVTDAEGHLEMVEFTATSHSLKDSAFVNENKEKIVQYVKMSGGVKRKRIDEIAGSKQKQPELLKIKEFSEDGSVVNSGDKDTSVVSGDSVPKSMQLWRYETQRHLPRFAVHWQLALAEIGYINCPMMECNYISLSEADMFNHYSHCDGKSSIAVNTCPICMCRLGTENDLKTHMLRSHPGDGFHRKTLQQVMIKNKWEVRPKVKLLAKRRSFCKVHRVSWNIAIESKGYVKCLFQNCSYLAITVDEMIKHYGICNGGGDIGTYPYPYKCSHCGGCVETEEKLQTHIEKSHTTEHSSYQIKLLPSSSTTVKKEEVLPTVGLMKHIKLETEENKDSSYCQDSFIITLNASDGNYTDDKHIQLVSVDKIKTEVGTADGYELDSRVQNIYPSDTGELHHCTTSFPVENIKSCPASEMLSINQVQTWGDSTASEELSDTQEEQNVANVSGVEEKYCQKKEEAVDIVIERMEKRVNPGTTVPEDIPDVSIQCVKPVPFTARRESRLNSEQTPDVSICTMEKPLDCVSTETDMKQPTYLENHLFSSDVSSSEQSDDIDIKPDIIESDTLSYLNMHHVKQYSSIYSGDSYKGRFYQRMHSKVNFDADTLGDEVTEGLDGCKNMEYHLVNDDHGVGSRSVLKTYSRRTLRAHSNATASRFSNRSLKEVTWLKKAESDITARHLNEPLDQCGGPGTFHDNCSVNNINASHLRDTGSTGLYSIVDKKYQVDSDVVEEFENSQNAQKSRSTSGATLVPEEISELVSSSECVNNMETNVCTMRDTEGVQSERKIDTSAIITSSVPEGKSEQHVSSKCVDALENDVSALMDTEILQSGRQRDKNSVGTVPEGNSEHTVSSGCVDAMDNDVCPVKDTEVLQSVRRRDTSTLELDSVPEGSSEHSVTTECVDTMMTYVSIVKDTEVVQSVMRRDTSLDGPDSVLQGNSEYHDSSECVDAVEADVSTVKNTEVLHSERRRDTISVKPDSVPEGSSEHSVNLECADNMVADVSTMNDTEVLDSGRRSDIHSAGTGHVSEGKLECHAGSVCVDAVETEVNTVRDTEVLQSGMRRDSSSIGPESAPEGLVEHSVSSEFMDTMETEDSPVRDTKVLQSGMRKDSSSIGPESAPEGHVEHSVSSEFMDAMETEDSPVRDTEVLQSGMRRDTVSVELDSVPEGKSEHSVSSECVDALEADVSTMNDTEALHSESRRDTNSVECDHVAEGKLECHAGLVCVDAMNTEVSTVKDTEIIVFEKKRAAPSRRTANVREGNSKHQTASEFMHAVETDINTVKSGRRRETPSTETACVSEENLAHFVSSECVDTIETNVSTLKDTQLMQSEMKRDKPSRCTYVPEGDSKHHTSSECVDGVETVINTSKDTNLVQSGRRLSTGTANVPEGNLARCASSECVDAMETSASTVMDKKIGQSGKRRGRPPKVTASVLDGGLELVSVPGCVDTMQTNVSTVKDTEVVQSGRKRGRPSRGTAGVPERNFAHCASTECVDAMETNVCSVKDTEVVQSGRRRGRPPKVTASVPEGNSEHCASSECVDTMETNASTMKDTEVVRSGRRRGRPPKVTAGVPEGNSEHCASSECVDATETNVCSVKDTEVVRSGRRRGRPPKMMASVTEGQLEAIYIPQYVDSVDTDDSILDRTKRQQNGQSVRSRRGRGRSRGRGYRGRCRNSLAQLVLRKERELEESAEGDSLVEVTCAKCSEEMQKKFFERHNRMKHCGLGWIEGTDPIDLNDEKLITRILTKVHHTRKWLTCETCGANKRSVVGFISHLQCCQKSTEERHMMRMACEICGRSMLPVSLKVHMSTVHKNPPKVEEVMTLEELEMLSKIKRAAATKAVSRMQEFIGDEDVVEGNEKASKHFDGLYLKVESRQINNFIRASWKRSLGQLGKVCCRHVGCTVESKTVEEALEHYLNCSMAPKKGYICRTCSFHCEEEPEMLSHVTSEHGNSPECSDNSDANSGSELETDDEEKSAVKKPRTVSSAASRYKAYAKMKISNKMKFLLRESSGPVIGDKPYVPAVKWTLTFHLENYMQSLYPNIHSTSDDWVALTCAAAAQYLPHTEESVQISRLCMKHKLLLHPQKAVKQWKRLKLFEAEVIDGIPMFFAGGPVWAMAWCPLPLQNTIYRTAHINQYLAVSCHSGMEDTYISGQSYSHSGLIQIWDFGHLDNQQPCSTPKLAVGIAHDYGAVWCMEWCPSGCYDTLDVEAPKCRLRRLGLLGAACSDGTVRIFSVCIPSELQDKICGSIPIFKVEAVRTLVLDDRPTCFLGDSKWQCTRLSWYKGKGHRIIAGSFTNGMVAVWDIATESPLLSKRVGKSCILYPYRSFQAHIGVVSAIALNPQHDGRYLMTGSFDRTTKYWDLEDTSAPITVSKRGSVTDGVWLTHWVSTVNSFDDSYSLGHANGTLAPVRQFGFGSYPLLPQNSVAWSLSTCDWMNAVAQSTLAGELTVIFSHQLLIAVDTEKGMRDKRMIISYTDIMHMEEQKEEGSKKDDVAEKPHTSQHSAGVGLPNEHDMDVDHSSGDKKSQLSFEDMFPKLESRGSIPVLREGGGAGNMDVDVSDNCDVSVSGSDNARTDGPNTEFRSVVQSPTESLTVSVQSDVESKESVITRNLTHNTLTDSVTLTQNLKNVSVSSRTSDLSQDDLSVTDSADAERSFSMESSVAIESMSKDDESMKNNVDCPEKMDHDSDKTKDSSGVQVVSYDQAHKKCGLILCDFPTDNLRHMPHEARLWMRQSDKMRAVDVDAYPIGSINRVSWNPNCRSFLWLAAGYHCGLVRVPCMQAMYCKPIEDILQHGERKVAALLNKVSKDLQ